jgi:PAS domain S-box-containing protein
MSAGPSIAPLTPHWTVVRPAQVAAGVVSAALGLIVVVAWLTSNEALTRVHHLFPPMPYSVAIGLLVCGVVLLGSAGGWRRLAGACAGVVLMLGLTALIGDGFDLPWNLHRILLAGLVDETSVGMAPSTALSFLLVGVGLLAVAIHPRRGSLVCAICGTAVAAQSGVAFVWYCFGFDGFYVVTENAPHVSAGLAVVGIGTIAAAWDRSQASASGVPRWLPLPIALGMALISISLWNQSEADRRATMEATTRVRAERIGLDLTRRASPVTAALVRLASAEAATLALGSGMDPRTLALLDLERFPSLFGVASIDASFMYRWVAARRSEASIATIRLDDRIRQALTKDARRHVPMVVDPVQLPSGDAGFALAVPVLRDEGNAGFIVGLYRYDDFFFATIGAEVGAEYWLRVYDGQREIYRHSDSAAPGQAFMAAVEIPFLGTHWRVQMWPRSVQSARRSLADRTLVFGLLFAGLLGWTVQLGQWSFRNKHQLTHANANLRSAIAERQAAQAAYAESEMRYKHLIDSAADIIYRTDVRGRFMFVNPAAVHVTKWSTDDLIGREYLSLIKPDFQSRVQSFYAKQAHERNPSTYFDFPILTADGREVWIGQHVQLLTEGERVIGFQAVARDISERMRIQHELQQMRDAALETARLKSEFVANTSHEIRTPLNGIVGFSSLLLDTDLDNQQRTYADGLRLSADALLAIVNDILDFSKIEAGMLRLEAISFDLRTTIDNSLAVFAETVRLKGLTLERRIEVDVPTRVNGDPSRLRQVLTNLLANAIKFTEQGSIEIGVGVDRESPSHVDLRFSVRDSGVGIDREAQHQLFQPFVQGDGSTSRRYGGTGLGLAICRQIVELMGGSIGVESEPGSGSTFYFTARLTKESQPATGIQHAVSLTGGRALIVADRSPMREQLVAYASGWGMRVAESDSGSEAEGMLRTAAAEQEPFTLVLLSLIHPREDAIGLARRIKDDIALSPAPKVVMIPSKGVLGEARAAHDNGIAAYLPRPVDRDELHQCLLSVLSRPTTPRTAPDAGGFPLVTRHSLQEQRMAAGQRVLVADDNPISQQVTRLLIQKLGYVVETAGNGIEAVQAAVTNRYAFILMDCQMPEMDGYMATAQIRQAEGSGRHTPIVAFTASSGPQARERCLIAGMDDFLEKPIQQDALIDVLNRWTLNVTPPEASTSPYSSDSEMDGGIDEGVIRTLESELGSDTLNEMILHLFDHAESLCRRIESAGESERIAVFSQGVHQLKGGALTMGFVRLGRTCSRLEEIGEGITPSVVVQGLEQIRRACSDLRSWQAGRFYFARPG